MKPNTLFSTTVTLPFNENFHMRKLFSNCPPQLFHKLICRCLTKSINSNSKKELEFVYEVLSIAHKQKGKVDKFDLAESKTKKQLLVNFVFETIDDLSIFCSFLHENSFLDFSVAILVNTNTQIKTQIPSELYYSACVRVFEKLAVKKQISLDEYELIHFLFKSAENFSAKILSLEYDNTLKSKFTIKFLFSNKFGLNKFWSTLNKYSMITNGSV